MEIERAKREAMCIAAIEDECGDGKLSYRSGYRAMTRKFLEAKDGHR